MLQKVAVLLAGSMVSSARYQMDNVQSAVASNVNSKQYRFGLSGTIFNFKEGLFKFTSFLIVSVS